MTLIPRGRTILRIIVAALLIAGAVLLFLAHRGREAFYRWVEARPVNIKVDLSQAGEFSGPFHQTCEMSHGEYLCLELPPRVLAGTTPTKLVANLRFEYTVTNAQGGQEARGDFEYGLPWEDYLYEGAIPLVYVDRFHNGDYTLLLRVTTGVPELAGVQQRLIARYHLCGMEMMPAFLSMVLGIVFLVIAAIIPLAGWLLAVRRRRKISTSET